MPPLAEPTTIRLSDALTEWLDAKVKQGLYKDRSLAIRKVLEATSRAELEAERAKETEGTIPNVPWFMIPLRLFSEEKGQSVYDPDRMFAPETYIPFGLWSDDRDHAQLTVEELKVGGGPDLMGDRPTPLTLATETCLRTGFPSRFLLDPNATSAGGFPICKYPNITSVVLKKTPKHPTPTTDAWGRTPVDILQDAEIDQYLERRLTILSPPRVQKEEPFVAALPEADRMRQAGLARETSIQSMKEATSELVTLRDLLSNIGFDLKSLYRDPEPDRTEPIRLALLAVAPEHLDRLYKRLAISMRDFQVPGPYARATTSSFL